MRMRHIQMTLEYLKLLINGTDGYTCIENGLQEKDFLLNIEIDPFNKCVHLYFLTDDELCPELIEGQRFSDIEIRTPVYKRERRDGTSTV